MNPNVLNTLEPFRTEALRQDIPADEVDRWIATALPCATLTQGGDGPVVGRFGGPAMAPPGTPHPGYPLIATIDCAALPPGTTNLPLPSDGQLMLFGFPEPDETGSMGEAIYVPAGAVVEEMPIPEDSYERNEEDERSLAICQDLPKGEIRLAMDVTLPSYGRVKVPGKMPGAPYPDFPHSPQLADAWLDTEQAITTRGLARLGGYASRSDFGGRGPVEVAASRAVRSQQRGYWQGTGAPASPNFEDWVLLAEWHCDSQHLGGGADIYWAIQRDDLVARRFEGVYAIVFWNP
ncbi:DUF1963 domain-containing protein [Micromonospora tulbaghiae]|uniref:DUF1963 domain-containing protein n=1 Tax=Micromonospora tulbaghiae TaxID=479978 RepID=UPI0037226AB5